jgi:hypothetical protein
MVNDPNRSARLDPALVSNYADVMKEADMRDTRSTTAAPSSHLTAYYNSSMMM